MLMEIVNVKVCRRDAILYALIQYNEDYFYITVF